MKLAKKENKYVQQHPQPTTCDSFGGAHPITIDRFHCGKCHKSVDMVEFARLYEPIQGLDFTLAQIYCHGRVLQSQIDNNQKYYRAKRGFTFNFKRVVVFEDEWTPLPIHYAFCKYKKRLNPPLMLTYEFYAPSWEYRWSEEKIKNGEIYYELYCYLSPNSEK